MILFGICEFKLIVMLWNVLFWFGVRVFWLFKEEVIVIFDRLVMVVMFLLWVVFILVEEFEGCEVEFGRLVMFVVCNFCNIEVVIVVIRDGIFKELLWDCVFFVDWVVGWEEWIVFWFIFVEVGILMVCDSICVEGFIFGWECFVFVVECVLDVCFLGGIFSLNLNKINVKCGDGDMI